MAIRLLPAGIEEVPFKRVPEGWLFTTANPWVYAPRRTYLVSDAQKPAIAARVRRGAYIRLILLVLTLMPWFAAWTMVPSLLNFRSVVTWLIWGGFAVVSTIALTLVDHLGLRPLLRDVPRSSQKIAWPDMLRRAGEAMSVTVLVIFTSLFFAGAAAGLFVVVALDDVSTSVHPEVAVLAPIAAVVLALFAIAFARMLMVKLRAR